MSDFIAIQDGDTVAFDVETNGLDWKKCYPVGYVVTVRRGAEIVSRYYPVRHESGPNLDPKKVIKWIKSWANKRIHLVGHNLKFDLHFAANDDITFPNATFEDTGINQALINEHTKYFTLDFCAQEMGATQKKGDALYAHIAKMFGGEADRKQMANYWKLPADDALAVEYAEGDGVSTLELYEKQQPHLDAQDLRRVHALECRCVPVLFRMERRGVKVDEVNLAELKRYIGGRLTEAEKSLPWEGFNVRGRKDVPAAFDKLGITDYPRTPLGNPSFTEKWMEKHELGRSIVTVRKLTNLQNSFIKPLVEEHMHKGTVHCNFNQLRADEYGTITGRLSCNAPNMQQVPKRDKLLAPIFRQIFVPREGMKWSQNDYSQQEYRIFATYTQSEQLITNYKNGVDMHQSVADKLKVERDPTAKRLNLGMLYWMGVDLLAENLGIPRDEAQKIRDWYDEELPEVKAFLRRAQKAARKGYVMTILGRRARFLTHEKHYQASSRIIQGTCADLTKLKMCEVEEFLHRESGGKCGVMLQIHDELDWEITQEDKSGLDTEARRIMSDFSAFPEVVVPMKVDSHVANDWGRASFPKADWSAYG